MKFQWVPLLALYLLPSIAFVGQGKPPHGDVVDADNLLKVHTFCLDTSLLTSPQLKDLSEFAAQAGKPKGVFSKLHWQRMDNCGDADAAATLTMQETSRLGPNGDKGPNAIALMKTEMLQRAKIVITSGASGKILYQGEGAEFTDDRQGAFGSAFSKLLKEVKSLSK
jgi:hypothetical protein